MLKSVTTTGRHTLPHPGPLPIGEGGFFAASPEKSDWIGQKEDDMESPLNGCSLFQREREQVRENAMNSEDEGHSYS